MSRFVEEGKWLEIDTTRNWGSWKNYFYEANAWTYSYFVPHDLDKLITYNGGKENYVKKLDFAFKNKLIELANEPSFLTIRTFNRAARTDLNCYWVNYVMNNLYSEYSLPGNDDSGAMSLWYIFSALGFFPNAGQNIYYLNTPIFKNAIIQRGDGDIIIDAPECDGKNIYLKEVLINGKKLTNSWFNYDDAVSKADYIIHLAGAGVADKRWSKERKQEIIDSRVKSGELICKTLQQNPNNLKALVSASAIGWYGPDPKIPNPNPFTEYLPHSNDYLGTTCYQWEQSVQPIKEMGKRFVILRTGIVLSNDGGALKEFKKPLKLGVASMMGNGKQIVSWIHIDDLVNLYITAMENENYSGVYNAVAPSPVNNETLVTELANQTKGKFYTKLPVPAFALKLALGEMSVEVLKSATVSSQKVLDKYFHFKFPTIAAAMADLAKKPLA